MTEYETLHERVRPFGTNSYLEVTRKRLRENGGTTEFVLITRGFIDAAGARRWTRFVTIPEDPALRAWLAEALTEA